MKSLDDIFGFTAVVEQPSIELTTPKPETTKKSLDTIFGLEVGPSKPALSAAATSEPVADDVSISEEIKPTPAEPAPKEKISFGVTKSFEEPQEIIPEEQGNIDLTKRPIVKNEDGTISTVRSISFNEDNKEILIPTVSDTGTIMSDDEAINEYHKTGKHLGKFNTIDEANKYAENLHTAQEKFYGQKAPEEKGLPEQIPLLKLSDDPQIAAMESRFISIDDPRAKAIELRSIPTSRGTELLNQLPKSEQENVKAELENLYNEDRKANAFALGILESTPIPTFFPEETKKELQKTKEAAPVATAAGQIAGTIGQAIVGGKAVSGLLKNVPVIAKSPLLNNALTRLTVSGGIAAEQNIGRKDIGESIGDVAQQAGGGLVSIVPEIIAPPGVAQLIAQPLGDLIYDAAVGTARGQDIKSKEWWKNEVVSLASSLGFAIKDVASGKTFVAEQAAQRKELKDFLSKNKDADIEIVDTKGVGNVPEEVQTKTEVTADVPRGQTVPEPLPEVTAPAELNVPTQRMKPAGVSERITEELENITPTERVTETRTEEVPGVEEKITSMEAEPSPLTMGGIAAGQELPTKAGNINLEKIDAGYDPKRVILETSADYAGKIDEARRGKITQETTRQLADDLGMSEKQLLKRRKGQAFNAEQALAARDLLNSSANRIVELKDNLAAKRKEGTLTDQDLADFSMEMRKHAAIQSEVAGMTAEAGRALNSFKIMSEAKQKAKSVEELLKVAGGKDINEEILDKLIKIDPDNVPAINNFIRKSVFAKTRDAVYEYWINAILSAPSTHIVNITSNTATGLYRTLIEKPVAAGIEKVLAPIQKRKPERYFREMPSEIYGFGKGLGEAVATMKNIFSGKIEGGGSKVEGEKYAIPGTTGKVIRTPTRALSAADEFFKTVVYRGTLNSLAFRQAKIEGKKGADIETRVNEILKDPPESMMKKAHDEAEYRTYTNPLGQFGKQIMKLRDASPYGIAKYIIPFVKTPTNIAKFALERTPVIGQGIAAHKIATGKVKGAEISDEIAKSTFGSLLAIATISLAKQGLITGAGSQNKQDREAMYRTGWLPYSVKLGDKYYSYSRLEPIGSVVGMAADFSEMNLDDENDFKSDVLVDYASKIGSSFGKNILSKTFMSGLSNFINAITDFERYGERTASQLVGSVVPNIIAAGARATDDEMKRITNMGETIRSRIPYISKSIPGRRDIWGNTIKKSSTGLEAFLSPVQVNQESNDKLDKELIKVNARVGAPAPSITYEKNKVDLDPLIYDRYTEAAGKVARHYVTQLVNTAEYHTATDEEKKSMIEKEFRDARNKVKLKYYAMQLRKDKAKE